MNLLAIDTSTTSTVLGLLLGKKIVDHTVVDAKKHSREILPAIATLMAKSDLALRDIDAIVFGQGPGSFTGLRIAVGVVQGLAYGAGLSVIPVSSMAVLAQAQITHDGPVFVALSARLEEIYYGSYTLIDGFVSSLAPEGVKDVSILEPLPADNWHLITDVPALQSKIASSLGVAFSSVNTNTVPQVNDLLLIGRNRFELGMVVSAVEASPVYLREQVTDT